MEKRTPHHDLARIQAQVARLGAAAFTKTALDGGREMGLTTGEMLGMIASICNHPDIVQKWPEFEMRF